VVRFTLLEYDERHIPTPLIYPPIGLMVGFTYIFPILAIITLPLAVFIIFSIFTGDISLVKDPSLKENKHTEEE